MTHNIVSPGGSSPELEYVHLRNSHDSNLHVFVIHRLPQPLNEHFVTPGAPAINAHLDARVLQQAGELGAGELGALVGIEDL